MARTSNPVSTISITLSLPERTGWYLDRLLEMGLYGKNRAEAAEIVIFDHCKALIGQGRLAEPPIAQINSVSRGVR